MATTASTTTGLSIGLRLVELIALLLPAVAILLQLIVRRLFENDDEPLTGYARVGFILVSGSSVLLLVAAVNTLSELTDRVSVEWLSPRLNTLTLAAWALGVGLFLLLRIVYVQGRPEEDSNSDDDDVPLGIE
ncbi:hypothetical protein [Halobellus limi]|uniref:Uncharacterized protein n=1 Tax=Halobellus limi TaxID=699433 RepID=A0A1H5VVH9_9EURY|nr:hypothetical protein [Halobellus limi]QCC46606.1 hypothetical protein DV707_02360 [Halobellus limi]SEF91234.1 hypothetical protein SAMN04488133_1083 [Halobellus limi]